MIWKHVCDVVSATVSTTKAVNAGPASLLVASTTTERARPMTEERLAPMRVSCQRRDRGRLTREAKRTNPLSSPRIPIDVAREERPTSGAASPTTLEEKRRAARAQNPKPSVALAMLA